MEEISLRPLTIENWEDAIHLHVRKDQKHFVASNVYSIAEAHFNPELTPMGIYAGEKMVGFLMTGLERGRDRWWLMRLMIDERHQGKGYGREALRQVIGLMRQTPGCDRIYLSYEPQNITAEMLYKSFGFRATGEMEDGEKVVVLEDFSGIDV